MRFIALTAGCCVALLLGACKPSPAPPESLVTPTTTSRAPASATTAPPGPAPPGPDAEAPLLCTLLGSLPQGVSEASLARLDNRRVLLTGGDGDKSRATARAFVIDAYARSITAVAPMKAVRSGHESVALADGRVAVVGASELLPLKKELIQLYDPKKDEWQTTMSSSIVPRDTSITALADGRALIAGGYVPSPDGRHQNFVTSVMIYDPAAGTVIDGPELWLQGRYHAGRALGDGRVELRGFPDRGGITGGPNEALAIAFVAKTSSWIDGEQNDALSAPWMAPSRPADSVPVGFGSEDHRPLVATIDAIYRFDPTTAEWKKAATMVEVREGGAAVIDLPGSVLVVGGYVRPRGKEREPTFVRAIELCPLR